jgi:hypothetical protein
MLQADPPPRAPRLASPCAMTTSALPCDANAMANPPLRRIRNGQPFTRAAAVDP